MSMNLIGKFLTNFRDFYKEINAATLTGAIDVVVVEQPDGSYTCSPFHVRFGKLGVLRSREKIVDIEINGEPLDIHMKLGESGEAFFVEEISPGDDGEDDDIPPHLACSPIPSHEHLEKWMQDQDKKEEQQVAKVFVAETVNLEKDAPRKLSVASKDFKPINDKTGIDINSVPVDGIPSRDSTGEHSSSSASLQQSGSKRKRRKKSKRGSVNSNAQSNQTVDKFEEVAVFPIEDVEKSSGLDEATSDPCGLKPNDSFSELERLPLVADRDYHFFSDTELTTGCSPESRPPSPVLSDTEVDQRRHLENEVGEETAPQSWKWGELPSPPTRPSTALGKVLTTAEEEEEAKKLEKEDAQRSMLSGMFSFMKKTKHLRHGQQEGVYLSDINTDDPEVAALYFSPHRQVQDGIQVEDDAESGNGPSIPQSPASQSPPLMSPEWSQLQKNEGLSVSLSLCGHLDSGVSDDLFNQCLVSYEDFVANPMMIENPNLVVKVGSKYYNWRMACPLVMSVALFKQPLPDPVVGILSNELMPASKLKDLKESSKPSGYYSWFTWRRSADSSAMAPSSSNLPEQVSLKKEDSFTGEIFAEIHEETVKTAIEKPKELDVVREAEKEEGYAASTSSEDSDVPSQSLNKLPKERRPYQLSDKCRKTLRLTSEQISRLNLQDGANEVQFSVTTAYQGTTRCKCHIYKWHYDDKIVISDIDGTITKSDVLGHVLPIVGRDWAQSGVAQLFTKIKNNGYKLLYLSARAIGQARVTREYLRSIKQGDLSLPDGPLLLNPTSLISAFHREVIERKPEEFKISCLRDILALFPGESKPFYAGYGNRVNDVWAYRAVGIPIRRIFTINYRGELKHELTQTFQSSYTNMCHLVDEMFPPPPEENLAEDFSTFVYWRNPLPEIDMNSLQLPSSP